MPPKIRFGREDIVSAALEIIREQGIEGVNARAVAARLGCSTQPLFREFESMEQIKEEAARLAMEHGNNLHRCLACGGEVRESR